jgi:hypothetical protein
VYRVPKDEGTKVRMYTFSYTLDWNVLIGRKASTGDSIPNPTLSLTEDTRV